MSTAFICTWFKSHFIKSPVFAIAFSGQLLQLGTGMIFMSHTSYMQTLYLHGALVQDSKRTSFSDSSYHAKGTCIVLPRTDGIPEWIMD